MARSLSLERAEKMAEPRNEFNPLDWSTVDSLERCMDEFRRNEIACLPKFLTPEGLRVLQDDVNIVRAYSRRRDIQIAESANTWRKMSTVGGELVSKYSAVIPNLYMNVQLLQFLSYIADEAVLPVADANENHVINILHREDDVHGGHIDTYAYAFNLVLDAPALGDGGELVVAFGQSDPASLLGPEARIFHLNAGDAYFLKTDTNVHGVGAIKQGSSRVVINMAYANHATSALRSYSAAQLY